MSHDYDGGWVPYDERTSDQQVMSEAFDGATPGFGDVNPGLGDLPETALMYDLEVKATGKRLNRIWQMEGSCVGAAAGRSYGQSMCGDIVNRKTQEQVKDLFPWTTWGIGRRIGGLNRRGAGSFGAAQGKAGNIYGMNAADNPKLPQPTNKNGWLVWSAKIELDYSVPNQWPVPEEELAKEANEHQVLHVARITKWDELLQAFAQGYGVTCASMFGTSPSVRGDVLIGDWNRSWAHQMSWSGYKTHPQHGIIVACDNQWGPSAHPECPTLSAMGVRGSFWLTQKTVEKLLASRSVEVFAHGNTEDWPVRQLDWDSMGMG